MKTSEKLKSILCGPDGNVGIDGSDEDRATLQEAIADVEIMETWPAAGGLSDDQRECIAVKVIDLKHMLATSPGMCQREQSAVRCAIEEMQKLLDGKYVRAVPS